MGEAPGTEGGAYRRSVETTLNWVLGDSAAKTILFYVGEPDPKTFETKLRSILGPGATVVLEELKRRQGAQSEPREGEGRRGRWLGRTRKVGGCIYLSGLVAAFHAAPGSNWHWRGLRPGKPTTSSCESACYHRPLIG